MGEAFFQTFSRVAVLDGAVGICSVREAGVTCASRRPGEGSKSPVVLSDGAALVIFVPFFPFVISTLIVGLSGSCRRQLRCLGLSVGCLETVVDKTSKTKDTTLGGGSLGSCVDEERSQLRELM